MLAADVPAARGILNHIIEAGGTTAYLTPFDDALFATKFLIGENVVCCHVALDEEGQVAGFQWLGQNPKLPDKCADIATFARRTNSVPGVGRALFATTCDFARASGFLQINATIRADNTPGLGYYSKIGFRDHTTTPNVALANGNLVDRVNKRFDLAN